MPAPRERLIRKLSRIQQFGERSLFLLSGPAPRLAPDSAREPEPAGAALGASAVESGRLAAPGPELAPARGGVAGMQAPAPGPQPSSGTEPDETRVETRWREIERQVRVCTLCRLCETRTNSVFGSGTRRTRLFVIGEGPGEQEDRRGEAFVGPAGELLTRILKAIGFERHQVFITNVVKCRPPRNRAPLPDEVAACRPYLEEQIDLVRPAAILTLGTSATQTMLETPLPISKLRGQVHRWRGIPLVPTYHPAALLRSPQYKRPTWEDVQLLRRVYDERIAVLEAAP